VLSVDFVALVFYLEKGFDSSIHEFKTDVMRPLAIAGDNGSIYVDSTVKTQMKQVQTELVRLCDAVKEYVWIFSVSCLFSQIEACPVLDEF
jgi:hypothetical protein